MGRFRAALHRLPRSVLRVVSARTSLRNNGASNFLESRVPLRVEIARSANELDRLRPAWEALWKASEGATIFQSFAWNRAAACVFKDREQPYVIYAADPGGMALIPCSVNLKEREIELLGEKLFDYGDLLNAGDRRSVDIAWDEIERLHLPFSFEALREDSKNRDFWAELSIETFCSAPFVQGLTSEEFESRHIRSARLLRKLQRRGVQLRQHNGSNLPLLQDVYYRKSQQQNDNLFRDPLRRTFILAVARLRPRDFEIYTLETAATLVAAIVILRDGPVQRFYTTYYDSAWAAMSPGSALLFEATRLSLKRGLICDYMTGEQAYKMRLATGTAPLYRVHSRPSTQESPEIGLWAA